MGLIHINNLFVIIITIDIDSSTYIEENMHEHVFS